MEYSFFTVAPIVLLPFLAFVVNAFIVKKFENLAVGISCGAIFLSFIFALNIFSDFYGTYSADYYIYKTFPWFDVNYKDLIFKIDMGFFLDNMTAVMLLMVTGTASLIHLFSTYYMKGDSGGYGRFFVYMSLFTSAMLGLVLADNLLMIFIFWELMGFCSYSLIGFYNKKEKAGMASIKAFMTTRVGDVFFLLGILAVWSVVGSVSIPDIYEAIALNKFDGLYGAFGIPLATFAAICIFLGTIGKSAQFPLQVWLPDAMMGPTPCSALIHAATMVAAGVYLSLRMYPLMELGGLTTFIAYTGAITAFGAATIALIQTDLKAVLAYSTISQLGYMVLGIGVGSYNAAFMHLITHAVFKACLFLSAGSVIHSLHDHHTHAHVQEMTRMGGLKKKMPFTFLAMMFCTLAIAGVPLFSGFVSKDRILGDALYWGFMQNNPLTHGLVPILGFTAAILTAFYMFRMMFLTFFKEPRDKELFDHTHEEKLSINRNVPLLILSVFTLGFWFSGSLTGQGLVKFTSLENKDWFKTLVVNPAPEKFLNLKREPLQMSADSRGAMDFTRSVYSSKYSADPDVDHQIHYAHKLGAIISVIIAFLGIFVAFLMYFQKSINPTKVYEAFSWWGRALKNKYYFDDFYIGFLIKKVLLGFNNLLAVFDMGIYDRYFVDGTEKLNRAFFRAAKWMDNLIVDSILVDGTGVAVRMFNVVLRVIQSGKIQMYFLVLIFVLCGYIVSL